MKCTNCGNELNPGQKFCTKCGTPAPAPETKSMGMQCPACGKALNPGQNSVQVAVLLLPRLLLKPSRLLRHCSALLVARH